MGKEYTRYFIESRIKSEPNISEWVSINQVGLDCYGETLKEIKFLRKSSFSKHYDFRIVKRHYSVKETIL